MIKLGIFFVVIYVQQLAEGISEIMSLPLKGVLRFVYSLIGFVCCCCCVDATISRESIGNIFFTKVFISFLNLSRNSIFGITLGFLLFLLYRYNN